MLCIPHSHKVNTFDTLSVTIILHLLSLCSFRPDRSLSGYELCICVSTHISAVRVYSLRDQTRAHSRGRGAHPKYPDKQKKRKKKLIPKYMRNLIRVGVGVTYTVQKKKLPTKIFFSNHEIPNPWVGGKPPLVPPVPTPMLNVLWLMELFKNFLIDSSKLLFF